MNGKKLSIIGGAAFLAFVLVFSATTASADLSDYDGHYEGEIEIDIDDFDYDYETNTTTWNNYTITVYLEMDVEDGIITGEYEVQDPESDEEETGEFNGTVDEDGNAVLYDEDGDLIATGTYDDETFTFTSEDGETFEMELDEGLDIDLGDICGSTFAMAIVGILALALIAFKK